jgi:hypothetical protein
LRIIFLDRTTRHHEATSAFPTVGAELSFGALPPGVGGRVAESRQQALEGGRQTRHDRVVGSIGLQFLEHRFVTEARVGAKPQFTDFGGCATKL